LIKAKLDLKSRLLLLTTGLMSVTAISGFIFFNIGLQKEKNNIFQVFGSYSAILADRIEAQFYERYGDVQAFTKNSVFQGDNIEEMNQVLDQGGSLKKLVAISFKKLTS
jgi:hypothetical protein